MYSPPPRKPLSKNPPAPSLARQHRFAALAGFLLLAALAWFFWPASYDDVKNLASPGANVIAFGDSLTAGYGAREGESYPARLSPMIGVEVINAGVSGDMTEAALARIGPDVLDQNPRLVLVGLGGNDFLRSVPLATTEANLRSIVRQAQSAGAMVVLLGFRFPSLTANYEKMYERVAEEEGCLLVPDLLDGILSNETLRSDAIHPNAKGYALFAERVAGPVRTLIARADEER